MKRLMAISVMVLLSVSLAGCWGRKNDDRSFVSIYEYGSYAANVSTDVMGETAAEAPLAQR